MKTLKESLINKENIKRLIDENHLWPNNKETEIFLSNGKKYIMEAFCRLDNKVKWNCNTYQELLEVYDPENIIFDFLKEEDFVGIEDKEIYIIGCYAEDSKYDYMECNFAFFWETPKIRELTSLTVNYNK